MSSVAKRRWILAGVLIASIAAVWWIRRRPPQYPVAYVGDRAATVWSTTAQVRQRVTTLGYGVKVLVIRQSGEQVQVRADNGTEGWIDARLLMSPGMWQEVADLLTHARSMPVQAQGHTRALSNLHGSPGRDTPRIFQFGRNVPVAVLERKTVPAPRPTGSAADAKKPPGGDKSTDKVDKLEDWLFVLRADTRSSAEGSAAALVASTPGTARASEVAGADAPIAGWILGRFVDLDPPQPIADYASSAGTRVIAWLVLNSVQDGDAAKPQYLVAGTHGGEGQPCDFTSLRVYTWGARSRRYETAFVENNLCGRMPIRVQQTSAGPEFRFAEPGRGDRLYRMKQTIVRRVKSDEKQTSPAAKRR